MQVNSLRELYVEQLKDLYDAEQQLLKALPKLADAATSDELRRAFEDHLQKTKGHAARLEKIFAKDGETTKAEKCKGMEGLIKEGGEVIAEDMDDDDVKDAALIAAAQRVEHYEMAGYGTVRTYATLLGDPDAAALLEQTLEEEKEADQLLTDIAESINVEAGADDVQERGGSPRKSVRKKPAA